jgi:MATE family multidrug resistance protein
MPRPKSLVTAPAGWREELAASLRLAWPLILSNLAQMAITTTDVLMLGRLGPDPLAASALAVNLYNIIAFTGTGLAVGTAPLIAAALGRRVEAVRETRRSFRMGIWLVAFYSLIGWLILWNAETLFGWFGQDPRLSAAGGDFMRILMWALLPALLIAVFRTLLTAFDRTPVTLIVTLGGVGVNALLNWMLIFGYWGAPRLGLTGSAIASLTTTLLMAALLGLYIWRARRLRLMHLFGRWWRSDWHRFRELVRIGAPIGGTWAFEVSVFSAAVYLMGLIDTASVAAHVIALQIAALSFMVPMGLAQAVTIRVGMGYGARDPRWIGLAGNVNLGVTMAFMSLAAVVIWSFPRELAGLFLDASRPESAAVLDLAVGFLLIAAVFQLADGAQVVGAAMLRGLQDTRVPMIYAGLGYWVVGLGAGAALAFWKGLAGNGVWIGLALGLAVVAALMLLRWSRRVKLGLIPA